ncbi:squalene--hopene cyclase [Pseudomonas frederiksbergensis]|uniref:squalene--hopene cyclase n=1 Tax=Pseudomonas frederiksbergensis TaxID=104087 RepID=UPI003D03E34E
MAFLISVDMGTAMTESLPSMNTRVKHGLKNALSALLDKQQPDGHWVFEFEADAGMTAEYVLLMHFLGEPIEQTLQGRLARYLRDQQQPQGGWPLLRGGSFNLNVSVKTYFALKLLGDAPHEPHLQRACTLIRQHGGAANCNVVTRIWLALYNVIPWRVLPVIPVEVILLPRWFPFHLSKIFCIPRLFTVAFSVLQVLRPTACNPQDVGITELFIHPASETTPLPRAPHQHRAWFVCFSAIDRFLHRIDPWRSKGRREKALETAVGYVTGQLNGEDGYGAALPTIAISLVVLQALGYPHDHCAMQTARRACEKLLVVSERQAYCQPCVSPIWDTAWACRALLESGHPQGLEAALRGLDWLKQRQILDVYGGWAVARPHLRPGGWAFQYVLPNHPDVDDTALVATVMHRAMRVHPGAHYGESIARAQEWVQGMQGRQGGWGAYEADNTQYYLNSIPFAEHGMMIDHPTADVSARCLAMLGQLGATPVSEGATGDALRYLLAEQETDGSWYGRWGINFIYGTWSALEGLAATGYDPFSEAVKKARHWLILRQNEDGGWGEDTHGYSLEYPRHRPSASTPSQTAWALLGLMAAGAVEHPVTAKGIDYLLRSQKYDGTWTDPHATGTGVPRVLYMKYHGYGLYFPMLALARYCTLSQARVSAIEVV